VKYKANTCSSQENDSRSVRENQYSSVRSASIIVQDNTRRLRRQMHLNYLLDPEYAASKSDSIPDDSTPDDSIPNNCVPNSEGSGNDGLEQISPLTLPKAAKGAFSERPNPPE